jgi:hypothetical protein
MGVLPNRHKLPMTHHLAIAGIPLPSSAPWFLTVIAIHVAAGIVAVIAGIVAMLSAKRAGRHPRAGAVYYWSLVIVCLTMAVVVIYRWPIDVGLGLLGLLAFGTAFVGRQARRRARSGWECVHIPGMGVSYIALLTAFYVDNGSHLPVWDRLPPLAFWLLPSAIGLPILGFVWWKRCPPTKRTTRRRLLETVG